MKKKIKVAVGMSGGVDSSVSALLLKDLGYDVFGLFMKNWEEEGPCNAATDFEDVVHVCKQLDIPLYSLNFTKEYKEKVFTPFLEEFKKGNTPNPDILCNQKIKFKTFFEKAKQLGAEKIATGHYAKIINRDDQYYLAKGLDSTKDQSYFLYTLKSPLLKDLLFPLGCLEKSEVKKIAKKNNLITSDKKESMGICFIGKRDFKPFLSKFIGFTPGNFEDLDGNILGKHDGYAFYTLGQRKGLRIGGRGDAWFVVKKDIKRNVVTLAQGKDHPALFSDQLAAKNLEWVVEAPKKFPLKLTAKVRYRQKEVFCTLEKIEDDIAYVSFDQPQRAVTPAQSIVFYDQEICLGGGMIHSCSSSVFDKILNQQK